MAFATKELKREYYKKYRQKNREQLLENNRRWYYANKGASRLRRFERKWKVLTHYGNGKLACVNCDNTDKRVLTLDHINGGGSKFRREGGEAGYRLCAWLKRNNYPSGYQVLCMNCQFIKAMESQGEMLR